MKKLIKIDHSEYVSSCKIDNGHFIPTYSTYKAAVTASLKSWARYKDEVFFEGLPAGMSIEQIEEIRRDLEEKY